MDDQTLDPTDTLDETPAVDATDEPAATDVTDETADETAVEKPAGEPTFGTGLRKRVRATT